MVRRKNVLSTIMMSFMSLGVIGILWALYGYSLAFGTDHWGIIGGFDYIGLRNVGQDPSRYMLLPFPTSLS
jgi:Amt family ammonium transporter